MLRLIYENTKNLSFFSEDNWSFFSKLSSNFKIFIWDSCYSVDHFSNLDFQYDFANFNLVDIWPDQLTIFYLSNCFGSSSYIDLVGQVSIFLNYLFELDLNSSSVISNNFIVQYYLVLNYWIYVVFIIFIFFMILFLILSEYFSSDYKRVVISVYYEKFITTWINVTGIKFESYEETLCVVVFWPWCIFLVFTHFFGIENNEFFFIFIEWGLPVLIGIMILIESFWLFGCHIFTYLTGSKGRRSFLATMAEDLIAFTILMSRVCLQIVRGVICGLYHDFFREISDMLVDNWGDFWIFSNSGISIDNSNFLLAFIIFFIDIYLLAMALFFIYFILFLQLLFLLIAVWLFCRCWLMSSSVFLAIHNRAWENNVICHFL